MGRWKNSDSELNVLELPESLCEEVEESDPGCSEVVSLEPLSSCEEVVGDGAGGDATTVEGLEPFEV